MNLTAAAVQEEAVGDFPRQRTAGNRPPWKWAWFIGFIVIAGCGTVDTRNTGSKPWNQPTKADVSQSWPWPDLQIQDSYWHSPGGHYP